VFWSFPFLFLLARHERDTGTKIWWVTKKGTASCVSIHGCFFFSFLLVTVLYIIQILSSPTTFLYIFFCFLPIFDRESFFFLCFPPIFDRGFSFSYVFLQSLIGDFLFSFVFLQSLIRDFLFFFLKGIHSLIVNEASFLGDPFVLPSEGKGKSSYLGSRLMAKGLRFWPKRLAEGRT